MVEDHLKKIQIIGVGGAGCNIINKMIHEGFEGVELVAVNSDAVGLKRSSATCKLLIGKRQEGVYLLSDSYRVGLKAAEESEEDIQELVRDADMVIVVGGMGGPCASGAAPFIARIAREKGKQTAAVVTEPFSFEGLNRKRNAEAGIGLLRETAESCVVIPCDGLLKVLDRRTSMPEALEYADSMLVKAVKELLDAAKGDMAAVKKADAEDMADSEEG